MSKTPKVIVLDDDPTGTQTVQNVAVLTCWDVGALIYEFQQDAPLFFILTNSRALSEVAAVQLTIEICRNIQQAAQVCQLDYTIISRGDSTLRGHFPAEPLAIASTLPFALDAWFIIPFFEEGGRITRNNVHYVVEQGQLIPCADTPFAQDATFGYLSSNLKEWVEEKSEGRFPAAQVESIELDELRNPDPQLLLLKILALSNSRIVVVNAETYPDLSALLNVLSLAQKQGKRFLFRTAASWVKAYLGSLKPQVDLIRTESRVVESITWAGGLVVVGSYVPKSSAQLEVLLQSQLLVPEVLDVEKLLEEGMMYLTALIHQINFCLAEKRHVLLYTSRKLVKTQDPLESLLIGNKVSAALVKIVQSLSTQPAFILAKGGITSSDLATKALGVKRALVKGQVAPGISLWELGSESRFPQMPYIVFPGNVGDRTTLLSVFQHLIQH